MVARKNTEHYGKYDSIMFRCKVSDNMLAVKEDQSQYQDLPRFYTFGNREGREKFLMEHLQGVYGEVERMVGR